MNKENPLVSVCVQTYQHVNYIKECLDGILMQQTTFPFEIILGEDESTDGTRDICIEYANKYPEKIKLFLRHRKDVIYIDGNPTGRYNVMENLKTAKGKYIALCEGDDYWIDPLKLQKQVDFLEKDSAFSGCFHNTYIKNEKLLTSNLTTWRNYNTQIFDLKDTISTIALFHTSSFMFEQKLLSLPKWFGKIQSADMALFTLIASKGKLYRIDEFMSVYRKNETGITNLIKKKSYHKNRITLQLCFKESLDANVHEKIDDVIRFHTLELSKFKSSVYNKLKNMFKSLICL